MRWRLLSRLRVTPVGFWNVGIVYMNLGFFPFDMSFLISASTSSVLIPFSSIGMECISASLASNADMAPTYVGSSVIMASPGFTSIFANS